MSEDKDRVGELRAQSAYCNANRRVVLVSANPELNRLLQTMEVVQFYPDTTDEFGNPDEATFKIKVGWIPSTKG